MPLNKAWTKKVGADYEHVLDNYPNIRLLNDSAVAVLVTGEVIRVSQLVDRMPLLILSKSECNRESIQQLLDTRLYRRRFSNVRSLEHSSNYEINARGLGRKAAELCREENFFSVFNGADKSWWNYYRPAQEIQY